MRFMRLTRTEWTVVAVVLALTTVVLAQVDSRELSNRSVCAANLRGIMQSMVVYASDNSERYPAFVPPASATTYDVTFKEEKAGKDADAVAEMSRLKKGTNNPMAIMWMLVVDGQVGAKQFVCKSDEGTAPAEWKSKDWEPYLGFQNGRNFSYSVAYPWTEEKGKVVAGAWWFNTIDAGLPIISDMAPYFGKTAADLWAVGAVGANERWAVTKANSANHYFEGQNVGFGDAHAEFARAPTAGEDNDSLWGIKKAGGGIREEQMIGAGTLPHAIGAGALGDFDVVMVPTRDARGELK
jgi:hypothetical protein